MHNNKRCVFYGGNWSFSVDGNSFILYNNNIFYRVDRATYDKNPAYGRAKWMGVHPATGDIAFIPNECLNGGNSDLTLYVVNACVRFARKTDSDSLVVDAITARCDCIINKVTQSRAGLLSAFEISLTASTATPTL